MNTTLNTFKTQQRQALALLEKLQAFLQQGEGVGIDIDATLKAKLQTAIQSVEGQKLKIALVGGFSEGKTSIAAAWMEKLEKSSMKISHQESSNEVKIYDVGSDFVLIDTPGLFGFKEQYSDASHSIEKYKDITKKYVSEAHLVLYVMNSTNPIKESHKDDLVWLFRTLNLLPRTVFVLSRFDEVADVEDEQDYQESLGIKRGNVTSRLVDLIGLSPSEIDQLAIIAVAANPFDQGAEYWLKNLAQFKALSHIGLLQEATAQKIKANGGAEAITNEMKKTIISDVLHKQLPVAVASDEKIGREVDKLDAMSSRLKQQLASTSGHISEVKGSLREFVSSYFAKLILQAKGLSMETFTEFFEREVGRDGVMITTRLQNEFGRRLGAVQLEVSRMRAGFDSEISNFNSTVQTLGKQGLSFMIGNGSLVTGQTVIATRDSIVSAGKIVGLDLGSVLKFKPWGAVNFANMVNGVLAVVGVAMEIWDSVERAKREENFRQSIVEMVENFEQQRLELLDLINGPTFVAKFFPEYTDLHNDVETIGKTVAERQAKRQQFREWRLSGEAIDVAFTEFRH